MKKIKTNADAISISPQEISADGEIIYTTESPLTTVIIKADVSEINCQNAIIIEGDVKGDINTTGLVKCEDVAGDIKANGSVTCGDVEGDINENNLEPATAIEGDTPNQTNVVVIKPAHDECDIVSDIPLIIKGDVLEDVNARGRVQCEDVAGDITTTGSVQCEDVEGDIFSGSHISSD